MVFYQAILGCVTPGSTRLCFSIYPKYALAGFPPVSPLALSRILGVVRRTLHPVHQFCYTIEQV